MSVHLRRKVYWVRNLPDHTDRHVTAQLLAQSIATGNDGHLPLLDTQVHVHSLARAVDPWEHVATRTATVTFNCELDLSSYSKGSRSNEWRIPVAGLRKEAIILDTHFEGFTPLNDPGPIPTQHSYDCIAISGLASHPFGSWQPRGDKSFMWIRDALPSCFSSFRFLTYGYDTTLVNSTSFQSISDLAGRFILDMRSNGWASPTSNRVLFLAHSLGGVLLKQVMVMLANSGAVETFMLGNIMGAVFFGTPSKGMEVSQLLAMTKDQPNQGLVNDLSLDSPYLLNLGLQFDGISELQRMKFFWAYETRQSPTVVASQLPLLNVYSCSQRHISNDMQKSSIDGSFSRSGPLIILVSKDSATNGLYSSQPLSTFQIDDDHSGMVKFSQGDNRTSVVAQSLRDIVDFRQSPLLPTVSGSSSISNAAISKPIALPSSVFAGSFVPSETLSLARSVATSMFSPDGMLSSHLPKGWNGTANPSSTHVSAILRCLQAPERNIRYEQIDPVHSHTFSWVYDKKSIGFTDWLRKGTGIFWISGKPGSGKSTLMKLIHSDHRTAQLLRPWGSQCRKVTATFFFHHRGSALQKSFEGLLRGIISQLIEKEPDLAIPLPIPLRNMLIREYSDRVNHEKLGDLGSDILKLFNRYGLKYDEDADKGIHEILRSLDPRAQLLEVFSGLFDVINDRQYENLERVLLSEQRPLQKSEEDGELDDMVQHLCTTKLRLRYTKTLTNLVKGWLARVNRRAKITWLLQQSGLVITEAIKEDISKCLGKQERRDAIFGETQRKFLTRQTLGEALSRLIRQDRFPLELTLFLDALDEYDGRPEFIAEFLTGIVQTEPSLTRVRVCFASRPWSVFVEEFGQCPGFEIHENTEDDIQAYCIDTMSASTKDSSTLTELVPEIVRRARGVFLWVRLVVQDLNLAMNSLGSQALGGAASVRHEERIGELRIILDSLPDKLSDYYAVILQRIPPSSRWDTYALLECVSRAQWVLDLNMAQMALQCSRSSSFVGSQERVLSRTWLGPNEFLEKVRTLSGGLVEAVGKAENGVYQTLQLMHQTVKEFVEDPEFKHKILGNLASIMFENGNSFLFKAYIVGSSTGMPKLQDADAAGHYATQAEITTGRSQYTFLSDATLTHYCTTGITFRPDRDLRCIMSPLRFAAYYGLHLFLKDTRISDCTRSHPRDTDAPFPALIAALKENYRPEEHVLETAKILLDCNYSPTETHILSLFECPDFCSPTLETLLLGGCKQLHEPARLETLTDFSISCFIYPRLTNYLLENTPTGANSTDMKGRTPLDSLVHYIVHAQPSASKIGDVHRSVRLLARHGASLRTISLKEWKVFSRTCGDEEDMKELGLPRWLPGFSPNLLAKVRVRGWRGPSKSINKYSGIINKLAT